VIELENINVQIMDMDTMVPEHLVKNEDNSYTIFLNARLSKENQLKSYYHALRHINENDFCKENVQKIEYEAHND
jgi:DNA-directed RNA polymerase specialized sigma54-like protein